MRHGSYRGLRLKLAIQIRHILRTLKTSAKLRVERSGRAEDKGPEAGGQLGNHRRQHNEHDGMSPPHRDRDLLR
jgi:hypothetical protein